MKTSLLLTMVLGAATLPAQDREFGTAVPTTLTAVRSDPDAFRNVRIGFVAQFAALGQVSNPFFTRFTPTEFVNVLLWADEQPIWQQEAYGDVFGFAFYGKMGEQLGQIFELRRYQRLRVEAVVRNTFQGAPWMEIVSFEPIADQVDVPTLAHMSRGEQLMKERKWQRAIAELSLAPGEGVPAPLQRAAYKNLGVCYLRIGESQQALTCLRTAAELEGQSDFELERLLATAEMRPALELDRSVGTDALRDFERPMWEAFEKDDQVSKTMR